MDPGTHRETSSATVDPVLTNIDWIMDYREAQATKSKDSHERILCLSSLHISRSQMSKMSLGGPPVSASNQGTDSCRLPDRDGSVGVADVDPAFVEQALHLP